MVVLLVLMACLISIRLPLYDFELPLEYAVEYFHLYTGFRFIAIVVAPFVAAASSILIARRAAARPAPLRRAAAVTIVTTAGTPPVVALLMGVRALLPGATPFVPSVPELLAVVAVGGWVYWSPVALALMGPPLVGLGWWRGRH
jgi:hypothetical protein